MKRAFGLKRHTLLGLYGHLESVGPLPVLHDPTGQLVHQLGATVADDVIHVLFQQVLRVQRVANPGEQR